MRGLLLLSVVGALLYGLLLLTADVPDRKPERNLSGHTADAADRTLRSWGHNLPALVMQASTDQRSAAVRDDPFDVSQERLAQVDVSQERLAQATVDGALQPQPETAGVVLAARVHSEPSVSSPTVRSFAPGTELQVVGRESGWVELFDPATHVRGWVLESYVWTTGDFSRTQTASLRNEDEIPVVPSSKQHSRSPKPAAQVANKFISKSDLRRGRWARRGDRGRRPGLFGRRFATFDTSW